MKKQIPSIIMKTNLRAAICVFLFGVCSLKAGHIYETFSWASVGDPGNEGYTGWAPAGKVDYLYNISKHEITLSQYAFFLNNVASISDPYRLWKSNMGCFDPGTIPNGASTSPFQNLRIARSTNINGTFTYSVIGNGNKPVATGWFDAARFCNWLHNGGALNSDTEHGAYELNGLTELDSYATNNGIVYRNADAKYSIPSLPEWFKAAFYDPNKNGAGQGGYWLYATQSDEFDLSKINANYSHLDSDGTYVRPVGSLIAPSHYGTYDQSGNYPEWNDLAPHAAGYRGIRGGSYENQTYGSCSRDAVYTDGYLGTYSSPNLAGFRIVTSQPNPQKYYVTLVLKSSTDLLNWSPFATYHLETYNDKEFYKADISVSTIPPTSP